MYLLEVRTCLYVCVVIACVCVVTVCVCVSAVEVERLDTASRAFSSSSQEVR